MESLKLADGSDQRIQAESAPLQTLFVLRKSRGWKMLVAQICMWTCLFCAVESLEDIFLAAVAASRAPAHVEQTTKPVSTPQPSSKPKDASDPQDDAKLGLLLLLTSLLGASI